MRIQTRGSGYGRTETDNGLRLRLDRVRVRLEQEVRRETRRDPAAARAGEPKSRLFRSGGAFSWRTITRIFLKGVTEKPRDILLHFDILSKASRFYPA